MGSIDDTLPFAGVRVLLETSDGVYRVEDPYHEPDDAWPGTVDTLTTGEDGWFGVITGVEWGRLDVTVDLGSGEFNLDFSDWDIVSRRGIYASQGVLEITNSGSLRQHQLLGAPGWYTVQVHARGRASRLGKRHHENGLEEHFLQFRKAKGHVSSEALKGPDDFGRAYL